MIKETNGGNIGKCLTEMLTLWLKQVDPPATWSAIIAALRQPTVGFNKLAKQIEKMYVSIDSKVAGSISNMADNLSFPHIDKIAPDEHTRQQLEGRLREESLDIIQEFLVVVNKLFDSLEDQNYPVQRLIRYLKEEVKDEQQELATMENIQTFIKQRSSFFDHRLVRYMINLAGTDEDKMLFHRYEESFLHYAKRRIYECPSKFKSTCTPDSVELHIKLDSQYDQCKLEDLRGFQHRLSSILQINIYCCLLSEVKKGCFMITFVIPKHVQETTFPLSAEQETCLLYTSPSPRDATLSRMPSSA